jgi:hypothetical protein
MNCESAHFVWTHEGGYIGGIKERFPGLLEALQEKIGIFLMGQHEEDPYHRAVAEKAKIPASEFYVVHAEDDDVVWKNAHDILGDTAGKEVLERYFTRMYRQPVYLSVFCCKGCGISRRPILSWEALFRIQMAAVTTAPNGKDIQA